ncbi:hypothetical protein ACJX0J_030860, partial [Zea mays]
MNIHILFWAISSKLGNTLRGFLNLFYSTCHYIYALHDCIIPGAYESFYLFFNMKYGVSGFPTLKFFPKGNKA